MEGRQMGDAQCFSAEIGGKYEFGLVIMCFQNLRLRGVIEPALTVTALGLTIWPPVPSKIISRPLLNADELHIICVDYRSSDLAGGEDLPCTVLRGVRSAVVLYPQA